MSRDELNFVVITCAAGSRENADAIAAALVEQRLAACVQIGAIESVFRWDGAVQCEPEFGLTVHTTATQQGAAIACIEQLHAYDVPGIATTALTGGSPAYLDWIRESVTTSP